MNDAELIRAGTRRSQQEDEALRLWIVLSRAYLAVEERVRSDLARQGLTVAEFGALEAIHHKGPMLLGDLKRKILVSSGGITYVVDRLVKKGLMERRPCEADRRAIWADLTPAGTRLIEELFPSHARLIDESLAGLSAAERKQAAKLLRQLGLHAASLPVPE